MATAVGEGLDVHDDVRTLLADGIVARRGAFERAWIDAMREDVEVAFAAAREVAGGAVPRGPQRWYVEIHPEQLRGFVDLVTHPWFVAVSRAVLGPDYEIVELGFDIPFPGAADQPWHRDFPSTPDTYAERRITSLAFNLTAVDTVPEMGPMEIAPGTQWEEGTDFDHGMFPPAPEAPRYAARAVPKLPQAGDLSVRSALTIHRGTANRSSSSRPVLVVGVDAPGAGHAALHDMAVTPGFRRSLPPDLRDRLAARTVEVLEPIIQKHEIEGLLMGGGDAG